MIVIEGTLTQLVQKIVTHYKRKTPQTRYAFMDINVKVKRKRYHEYKDIEPFDLKLKRITQSSIANFNE